MSIAAGIPKVLGADIVTVVLETDVPGDFRIAGHHGGDPRLLGSRIDPGEGITGQALTERAFVRVDRYERPAYPSSVLSLDLPDAVATAAVPILAEERVIGGLAVFRRDLGRPFGDLDREVLEVLAGQIGLAILNSRLQQELRDASIRDALTGLHNRRHLDASLDRILAARARLAPTAPAPLSAILFDLDHFGRVNKEHGHAAGDAVLRGFGAILASRFRSGDIVARYGGEEFLVVLDGATREQAAAAAEAVGAAFRATELHPPGASATVRLTVSAGVASLGAGGATAADLLARCDEGLRAAKRAGRDRVVTA
jgi:diguanylate cyclase (GGDEF)-like protein